MCQAQLVKLDTASKTVAAVKLAIRVKFGNSQIY